MAEYAQVSTIGEGLARLKPRSKYMSPTFNPPRRYKTRMSSTNRKGPGVDICLVQYSVRVYERAGPGCYSKKGRILRQGNVTNRQPPRGWGEPLTCQSV